MHIRRGFSVRLVGQSLKRIGAALKHDLTEVQPALIETTNPPIEPPALVQTRDPAIHPEIHDQIQRTTLLTQLAIELRAAFDPPTIAHNLLATMNIHSSDASVAIVLVGSNGAIDLALSNNRGLLQPIPSEQARRLLERGPAGWNWRDSSSVLLANDAQLLDWEHFDRTAPAGSIMALPLAHAHTSFGLLTISHQLPNHFTSQDLLLFEGVAAQASLALRAAHENQAMQHPHVQPISEQAHQITHSRDPMHIIFDHLPDGLVLLDAGGHILIANEAFCEDVLSLPPRATIGRRYAAIIQDLQQSAQIAIEPHPSIPTMQRARCAGTDGRQRWYDIDRYSVAADDGAEQLIERWRDITRQEEQQREQLHDEQLTTMARLAGNVVHEIGNPLQSVRSCIDLSREDRTLAATTTEYLELASSELRRMSQILSQLRDLYRLPLNEANNE
jgi:GAF domain-containing protein